MKNFNARRTFCRKGFTLLEVLVAVAILSTVIVTLVGSVNYHLSVLERGRGHTVASMIAREKIEEIKLGIVADKKSGSLEHDGKSYAWNFETTSTDYDGVSLLSVRVMWDRVESVAIETYVRAVK